MNRKTQIFNAAAFLIGVFFLVLMIYKIGFDRIGEYLHNVGWRFFWLVLIHLGVTFGDIMSLKIAIGKGVSFFRLVFIGLAGAAINALTPIGEAGEAVKGTLLAPYVPAKRSISALVVWNFIYRITKYMLVFAGPFIVYLLDSSMFSLKVVGFMFLAALISFMPTMLYALALWKGASEAITKALSKLPILNRRDWSSTIAKAKETDQLIAEFTKTRKKDAILMGLLLIMARMLVVLEIHTALYIIGHPVSFPAAFFLFTGGTVMATFLSISPVQLGVREAGAAVLYHLVGLPASAGFTQAFIRRLRQLLYNLIGLSYLAWASFTMHKQGKPKVEPTTKPVQVSNEERIEE